MPDHPINIVKAAVAYAKDAPRDKDGLLTKESANKVKLLLNYAKNAISSQSKSSSKSLMGDAKEKAGLLADVLGGLFGKEALGVLDWLWGKKQEKSLFYWGFKEYAAPKLQPPSVKPSTVPSVAQAPKTQPASHQPGIPFKGPSGRWFVVRREDGRTVPAPDPNQQQGTPGQGRAPQEQGPGRRMSREEQQGQHLQDTEDYISRVKGGEELEWHEKVTFAASLLRLSGKELASLKEKHGLKAEDQVKADLVRKIMNELKERVPQEKPDEKPAGPGRGAGTEPASGEPGEAGGGVEGATEGPGDEGADQAGEAPAEPPGEEAAGRVPARQEEVNKRLDRYEKLFRSRGHHEQADWMKLLRDHVNMVGTDEALKSLGEEVAPSEGSDREVLYEGGVGWEDMSQFMQAYLDRNGIVSVHAGGTLTPEQRSVSSLTSEETETQGRGAPGDFKPQEPGWGVNKLKEAQHLPGLEKSEDLSVIMGGEFGGSVSHFSPDVIAKLDERFGKYGWVVKPYNDEGFAGRGIFFPQFIEGQPQDARNALWTSGENLARYGFSHLRDKDGRVAGIKHQGGDEYLFGTEKYENTIQGDARRWADEAEKVAGNENMVELPFGGKGFMAQSAFPVVGITNEERAQGVTIKKGVEGRTHIVTRNGKAEWIPHSTWMKKESLPVVFESEDTRAMAQAAVDAINALPESERNGQTYAPDIVKTANGFKVLEANPSAKGGGSGYLEDNPFIIDSYVSHITGREPAHVRFIRRLLTEKKHGKAGTDPAGEAGQGRGRGGQGRAEGVGETDSGTEGRIDPKEPEKGTNPKGVSKRLSSLGVGSLPASDSDEGRWDHPLEVQKKHNQEVLAAAKKGGLYVSPEAFRRVTKSPNVGGQEHDVHEDAENNKFYKFTKGGRFGQNKDVHEYLERNEIANKLWPSLGYKFHGITENPSDGTPQAVMSMNRIEGTHPEQQEIHDWFEQNGWEPKGERSESPEGEDLGQWDWLDPKTGTVIGDAHAKNFIKTFGGLVPIDVDILPGKEEGEKGYYKIRMKSLRMNRIGRSILWT